jgi:hypothetical protein
MRTAHWHIGLADQETDAIRTYEHCSSYGTAIQAKAEILYRQAAGQTWEEQIGQEYVVLECSLAHRCAQGYH